MQCRLVVNLLIILFVNCQLIQSRGNLITDSINDSVDQQSNDVDNENSYNGLACEDETLKLECLEGVITVHKAYYGRFSIQPCNPERNNSIKINCYANGVLDFVQTVCNWTKTCQIPVNSILFGNPCTDSLNMLEVIYNCTEPSTSPVITKASTSNVDYSSEAETITLDYMTTEIRYQSTQNISLNEIVTELYDTPNTSYNSVASTITSSTKSTVATRTTSITARTFTTTATATTVSTSVNTSSFASQNYTKLNDTTLPTDDEIKPTDQLTFTKAPEETNEIKAYNKKIETINEDIKANNNATLISVNNIKNILNMVYQATDNLNLTTNELKEKTTQAIIATADILLTKTDTWKELDALDRGKSITVLMDSIEKTIFNFTNSQDFNDIHINTSRITAELKVNKELKSELKFPSNTNISIKESVNLKLKNPRVDQKFLFIVYKDLNDLLLDEKTTISVKEANKNATIRDNVSNKTKHINTNIISFKMDNKDDMLHLSEEPIQLIFTHLSDNLSNYKPICSYWSYNDVTYEGEWKSDGCSVKISNKTHTVCSCTHLTHFAVLMDIYGVHDDYLANDIHQFILKIITIVFSTISLICIVLTLLAFKFVTSLKPRKKLEYYSNIEALRPMQKHLYICLLISLLLFLTGMFVNTLKVKIYCTVVAIMSHYFFLCAFFWMLLNAMMLYLLLAKVLSHETSIVIKACAIGYGTPLLIVGTSTLVNFLWYDGKGYGTATHCWLSNYNFFNLSFIAPVTVILFVNIVIFVLVIYSYTEKAKYSKNMIQKDDKSLSSLLIMWCLIMNGLGIPWILGYFMLDTERTIIFSYIFTIINSSQGILIFIYHCVSTEKVRKEIMRILTRGSLPESTQSTSSTNKQLNNNSRSISYTNHYNKVQRVSSVSSSSSKVRCVGKKTNEYNIVKPETNSTLFYKLICCLNKDVFKSNYNSTIKLAKHEHTKNKHNNSSGSHTSSLLTETSPNFTVSSSDVPLSDDELNTKLLMYENNTNQRIINNNINEIKNPLHYHQYHHRHQVVGFTNGNCAANFHTLQRFDPQINQLPYTSTLNSSVAPKRTSSHASSNSDNSNRTQMTYVCSPNTNYPSTSYLLGQPQLSSIASSLSSTIVSPTTVIRQQMNQQQQQQHYLIPRSHTNTIISSYNVNNFENTINKLNKFSTFKTTNFITTNSIDDENDNYANNINLTKSVDYRFKNTQIAPIPPPLPPSSQPPQMPLNMMSVNNEEHNYSLIESEFQPDSQYYLDEPICAHAVEEEDFNLNSYMEMPNQYDELDDIKMLATPNSSLSSFSLSPKVTKKVSNSDDKNDEKNRNQTTSNVIIEPKHVVVRSEKIDNNFKVTKISS